MHQPREEIPTDLTLDGPWTWITDPRIPANEYQALMETAPGDTPQTSLVELQELREAVADCMTALDEQDLFILNALEAERISQRQLGRRLGLQKSHTNRLVQKARANLAPYLRSHPTIQERFHFLKPTDWNQAAADAVNYIKITSRTKLTLPFDYAIERGKETIEQGWDNIPELRDLLIGMGATAYEYLGMHSPETLDTIVPTLIDRHRKYGPGNIAEFLEVGLLVRMSDKVARIRNGSEDFADDTYLDAYVDLVGYASICHMLAQDTFFLPLAKDPA